MPNQLDAEVVLRLKNLEKIINDVKKGFSQIKLPELNFSQRDGQNLITFIRALSQSGPQVRAASQNLDQFNAVLGNTARILNVATPGLKAYSNAQRAATQATTRQTQAQSRQVSIMEDLGRQTAITVRRFSGFLIARDLIFGLGFAFRSSITDAIKFEREISKIAQLQNTSLDSARQLGKFISNLAVQFGASATELAQSGQVLAQAGKSVGEIQTILKSLGQASLTPTFGDLTKTTDSLLAVLGQFELKAKDTAQVLDILNSVSKDFNVSVDELFEGVRRAGSTFAALSGVKEGVKPGIESLKEFVALFTSVIDTSRESAETIGTAFRTILPRLLRGNTRELLKKELGLDLLDDNKQFIGPFKAIQELFKSLGNLKGTDINLSKIVEELGGTRQFNRILPLILEFPKAQRALDLANKSSGSVAKDTQVAFQTLAVQLEQVKQKLQEIGRDLVSSGTFRAFADGFLVAAKSAGILVKALEPLIPLITTLATVKAVSGATQFSRGFFNLNPAKKAGGGSITKVSSLLTPGELIIGPNSVRANGEAALRKFNATGDISSIRSLKGVSMVPGTGNTDSVHANLEPGSFVIKKSSVQKALGLKKYAQGGAVRLASGGPTFGLNPQLSGLDPATTSKLIRFGGELSILGDSTKKINRLFKSILASSRDLPTALQRISLEVDRALGRASAGTSGLRRNGILAGSTSTNKINIPQSQYSVALPFVPRRQQLVPAARDFTLNGGPRAPVYSQVTSAPQLALPRPSPITDPRFLLPYYPTQLAKFNSNFVSSDSFSLTEDFKNAQLRQSLISRERENKQNIIARALTRRGVDPRWNYTPSLLNQLEIDREQRRQFRARGREINSRYIPASNTLSILDQLESGVGITPRTTPVILRDTYEDIQKKPFFSRARSGFTRARSGFNKAVGSVRGGISRLTNSQVISDIRNLKAPGQGTNIASIGAILAGGALSSSGTRGGSIGGGALSGAGFGLQAGIATGNPIVGIIGALGGAFVGATNAADSFSRQLRETNLQRDIAEFLSTDGKSSINILGNIASIRNGTGGTTGINAEDFISFTRGLSGLGSSQSEAFRRASFSDRLSSIFSTTPGARGAVARAQNQKEILSLKESLIPANQLISSNIFDQINKGKSSRQIREGLSQNQLEVLATSSPFLNNIDELNDAKRVKELGEGVFNTIYKSGEEAYSSINKLKIAISKMNSSIAGLEQSFNSIGAALRKVDILGENFDKTIQSIINPSELNTRSKLNIFRDISGVPTSELRSSISGILQNFNLNSPQAIQTADSALAAGIIQNDLSNFITNFKDSNAEMGDVLRQFSEAKFGNFDPKVLNAFTNAVDANFSGDKNVRIGTVESESQVQEVISILNKAFSPSLKIFEKIQDVQQNINERTNGIINQRTGVTRSIADQQLGINALGDRRIDIKNQLLGRAPASLGDIQRRVGRDVTSLTGGALSPSAILAEIQNIQKGGVGEDEATRFSNLTKALELLSSDTRILDATLEKNNQLQEVKGNTRSFLERVLSGPDEIAKINQELRDASVIGAGGRVSPTRATAAVRTSQQIFGLFNNEDSLATFGKTSAGLENDLNNILKNQATPFIGDKKLLDLITKNLNTPFALGNQATRAIDTQAEAASSLQQLDQQRVEQLNQLIQEQAGILGAAVRDAFNNEQVNQLTTALGSLKDAQLTLTGKTEVVVSFNNANGVFNGIQDELKTFIGGVVNEQIKQALQGPKIAGANTA